VSNTLCVVTFRVC